MRNYLDEFPIFPAVGYMLKVLKVKKRILQFKSEFAAIRHGDYLSFITLVKGPFPFVVVYKEGAIESGYLPPQEGDIDFELMIKAGPSIFLFYKKCFDFYGPITDPDISDEVYKIAVNFEISLRMYSSNFKLANRKVVLKDIIDIVGIHNKMNIDDVSNLHQARHFINMIKHPKKQFNSWEEGNAALVRAYEFLRSRRISD